MLVAGWALGVARSGPALAQGGACPGDDGVSVVVDATALGGEVEVGCASGPQPSGFDAAVAAGFTIETVATTPGLLCRIDGLPSPEDEDCAEDPPPTSYWAYWVVSAGSWAYASEGAATRHPEPGSVEGWSFVDGPGPPTPPRCRPVVPRIGGSVVPTDRARRHGRPPWGTALGVGVAAAFAIAGYRATRRRARAR